MKPALNILDQLEGEEISCASVLKVLADETRLAVVEQLLDGPKTVSQINEVLGVEPTLLSHHLKALREAQLVVGTREGRYVSYSLAQALLNRRKGRALDLGCCTLSFS
ncbi:ArsR family transcriptional regulator [Blastopirellula marina]|uniref:ArsR family transcriptional regulator n=1 Tax=Blastopirellula marina TaxID=124 RepID=A0A2S8EZK3_9BACT|nr:MULTISPECIES: metalloregulator ArsR/SmtB family transcription factor [Pirellulaceae]PQO25350.1 ArsR family transcriptional regulator [Blastopirellula marina]RCS41783.1 ArsR family transcriptional regulator [Bremerella cremea]